ncbi:MAG: 4Fe-4S binding protein [Desulfobacterales bacterium]|nr:4Fe-4S binding protein [Desulfobacterales bacterium]
MPDKAYIRATICFWSGTGNSYRVSNLMGKIAENSGLETHILSLDKARSTKLSNTEKKGFIGIVFPTHGFTAPWHVLKSVWKLPQGNFTHVYCIATRAGLKFGSVFIPGISGSATFVISLILLLKGYKVCGTMSVDMPSNWYSLHPIQTRKSHEAIIDRAEHKVTGFMNKILSQSKVWFTTNNLYEITLGILLSFVSLGYLLFGKFFLAKLFFANSSCDGCGLCEKHCPVKAITMWGNDQRRPYWKYNCESCMKCAAICPHNAIEAGHSWGVILYVITAFPISVYLFSLFGVDSASIGQFGASWIGTAVNIFYFYPAIFVSYYFFNLLIRIPLFNYLFTHTTMTHLPFWGRYREPKTKLKDIA